MMMATMSSWTEIGLVLTFYGFILLVGLIAALIHDLYTEVRYYWLRRKLRRYVIRQHPSYRGRYRA